MNVSISNMVGAGLMSWNRMRDEIIGMCQIILTANQTNLTSIVV
jgi:hypothetical protein